MFIKIGKWTKSKKYIVTSIRFTTRSLKQIFLALKERNDSFYQVSPYPDGTLFLALSDNRDIIVSVDLGHLRKLDLKGFGYPTTGNR